MIGRWEPPGGDPAVRELRRDWEDLTSQAVAALRAEAGTNADDPRLRSLVGELSLHGERFRTLWARHEVANHTDRMINRKSITRGE
ncbi:hypothetical protein [Streptomyces sp. NPDC091215]|uniref:MmyB family transcriptional regulator n=1 Tax=Streptomyces sp. NPDC091215 TaxID=3155192 RepID=UPI0034381B32